MALFGRSTSPRPHLARPIVTPASTTPVFVPATIKTNIAVGSATAFRQRRAPKPHLAAPIVAPGGPRNIVAVRATLISTQALASGTAFRTRSAPLPHRAPAIVSPGRPVVPGITRVFSLSIEQIVRRTIPKPHTAQGIVAPGGAPIVVRHNPAIRASQVDAAISLFYRRQFPPRPHLSAPIVAPGGPQLVSKPKLVGQALQAPLTARRVVKPNVKLALPVVQARLSRTNRGNGTLGYALQTANTITSGSFSPTGGSVLIVMMGEFTNDPTPSFSVTDTFTGTSGWTVAQTSTNDGSNWYHSGIAWATAGPNPGTGTVTATRRAGNFSMGMQAEFISVVGNPAAAVLQNVLNTANLSASLALNFTNAPVSSSFLFSTITDDNSNPTLPTWFVALANNQPDPAMPSATWDAEDLTSPNQNNTWSTLGGYRVAGGAIEVGLFYAPLRVAAEMVSQAVRSAVNARNVSKPKITTAKPVVAPGGPVVPGRTIVPQALQSAIYARRGAPKPHLASTITVAPPLTAPVPPGVFIRQARQRALQGRTIFAPHVTKPIVVPGLPVVPGRTAVLQYLQRALTRRTIFAPHTAKPVIVITPPVPPAYSVTALARQRALIGRTIPAPHIVKPIVAPGGPVVPGKTVVLQSLQRALTRRTIFAPHRAPFVVAAGGPVIASRTQVSQAVQSHLNARRPLNPRPHLAPAVVSPGGPQLVPHQYELIQTIQQDEGYVAYFKRQFPPRPHIAKAIVAPGGPVIVGRTQVSQALQAAANVRRPLNPRPHVAPPIITAYIPPPAPLAAGTFVTAARQSEAYVRRGAPLPHVTRAVVSSGRAVIPGATIKTQAIAYAKDARRSLNPRPHLAPPNLSPKPFPPAKVITQSIRSPYGYIGHELRPVPKPHVPKPIVAPGRPVIPGATKITTQSNQRMRIHRTGPPRPHLSKAVRGAETVYFTIGAVPDHAELGKLELMHQAVDRRWAGRFAKTNSAPYSLIKESGVYTQVLAPSSARINAAQAFYQGGRTYVITEAEAAALIAAGYGAFISYP